MMSDQQLDITKEHCPMTFVKTKLALAKMEKGQILEVRLCRGEPLENVPRSATEQGFEVLSIEPVSGDIYRIKIRK